MANFTQKKSGRTRKKKNHRVIGMRFKTFLQGLDQLRMKHAGDK